MIRSSLMLCGVLLVGCASATKPPETARALDEHQYEPASASALAFDAPIFAGYELDGLDRAAREPGVFMGYQDSVVESFSIGMIDHQSDDPCLNYYDRFTYSTKVGTRYR